MKILISLFVLLSATVSQAQILTDETWGARSSLGYDSSFADGAALKRVKKVGLTTTLAGATGLFGLNMDINFGEDFAISLGYGLSPEMQAANLHFKQSFGGRSFLPYFVAGYSRWFSNANRGGVSDGMPSVLKDRFLTEKEIETGEFGKNILYPGLGLEYLNLTGDWSGVGFFAEVLMLLDVNDFAVGYTGGVGTSVYF